MYVYVNRLLACISRINPIQLYIYIYRQICIHTYIYIQNRQKDRQIGHLLQQFAHDDRTLGHRLLNIHMCVYPCICLCSYLCLCISRILLLSIYLYLLKKRAHDDSALGPRLVLDGVARYEWIYTHTQIQITHTQIDRSHPGVGGGTHRRRATADRC